MVAVLENKTDVIAALCRKYNVARLYAFGSALRDDFRPGESDVDLLVEFAPMDGYDRATAYFDMLDELEAALDTRVDLVMAGAVKNRYISAEIERTKQILYCRVVARPICRTSSTLATRSTSRWRESIPKATSPTA